MKNLGDSLLGKLNSVKGSLVDVKELIDVLQETKKTAGEVSRKLKVAAKTEKKINPRVISVMSFTRVTSVRSQKQHSANH